MINGAIYPATEDAMTEYKGLTLDKERALYGISDARVCDCRFDGPADGESALKECRRLIVDDCDFQLRYPLWHAEDCAVSRCRLSPTCRAAFWYDRRLTLTDCAVDGIKALRECDDVRIRGGHADSPEFGWKCRGVDIGDYQLQAEYAFLMASGMRVDGLRHAGKYAFQYVRDAVIRNSMLDTKDAFWHSDNVTVIDSVIRGEYLAWYSTGLRLERCRIIGTQPLCYCKGLELIDCEMVDADLAFERSEVRATVRGDIVSVKNPSAGFVRADRIGTLILDEQSPEGAPCAIDAVIGARKTSDED